MAGARGATPRPRVETRFCLYSTSRSRGPPGPDLEASALTHPHGPRPAHVPPRPAPGGPEGAKPAAWLPVVPRSCLSHRRGQGLLPRLSCSFPSPGCGSRGRGSGPASGPGLQPPGLTGSPPARPYHARFSLARPPRSLDHSGMFTEHLHVLSSVPKASRCRMDLAGWPRRQRVWCL